MTDLAAGGVRLICGDCLEVLPTLEAGSVDAVVCDPPYGLGFMGKSWDKSGVAFQAATWEVVARVCKPGAHLLAFGGTRTFHRLTCVIEDAGWEIRDCIGWIYGSGFPKSLDVSKAIDKAAGVEREVVGQIVRGDVEQAKRSGVTMAAAEANRNNTAIFGYGVEPLTVPATDAAKQWDGWGTALKPAWEPIIVARKPLAGTVAENVLKYGTGALNIDGCRVATDDVLSVGAGGLLSHVRDGKPYPRGRNGEQTADKRYDTEGATNFAATPGPRGGDAKGRWPANLIHDGGDEVVELFPEAGNGWKRNYGEEDYQGKQYKGGTFGGGGYLGGSTYADSGNASRFFYCAKASREERDFGLGDAEDSVLARSNQAQAEAKRGNTIERGAGAFDKARVVKNNHPTVKPLALMEYLVRLVAPEGALVLDPFLGSGTTGVAAIRNRCRFVGIEKDTEHGYFDIATRRIERALRDRKEMLF